MNTQILNNIEQIAKAHEIDGAMLVLKKGETLAEYYCGIDGDGEKIDKNTRFHIAGLTNSFTIAAALLLTEQGKLSLEDRLTKFFPELSAFSNVTIAHMLRGQTGLPDYIDDCLGLQLFDEYKNTDLTQEEIITKKTAVFFRHYDVSTVIELIKNKAPIFEAGKRCEGNSTTYFLLGEIVSAVSQMSLGDFFRKYFFAPLHLDDTSLGGDCASACARYENGEKIAVGKSMHADGASGIVSTLSDLAKWLQSLFTGKILSPASRRFLSAKYDGSNRCCFNTDNGWTGSRESEYGYNSYAEYHKETDTLGIVLATSTIKYIRNAPGVFSYFYPKFFKILRSTLPQGEKKLIPINEKYGWDMFDLELTEEQEMFISPAAYLLAYAFILQKEQKTYALVDNKRVVGIAVLQADKKHDEYWICNFMIDKYYQKQGYGKYFIKKCRDLLIKKGAKKVEIAFYHRNTNAEKTYTACGFVNCGTWGNITHMEYLVKNEDEE